MKNITDIKKEKEEKVSQLIKVCKVFFAFSNTQFYENKTPLEDGEKYVSIGGGGYMPKGQVQNWRNGWDEIDNWYKAELKSNKARKANILYELDNHEAYYTGDIESTLDALGEDYTRDEVWKIFKNRKYQIAE